MGQRPSNFNGMSGSVVIADIDDLWKFAGMVTLASEPLGQLNFIPAEKIAYYLNKMVYGNDGGGITRGGGRPPLNGRRALPSDWCGQLCADAP